MAVTFCSPALFPPPKTRPILSEEKRPRTLIRTPPDDPRFKRHGQQKEA